MYGLLLVHVYGAVRLMCMSLHAYGMVGEGVSCCVCIVIVLPCLPHIGNCFDPLSHLVL